MDSNLLLVIVKRAGRILLIILFFISGCGVIYAQTQKPKNRSWYDDKILHFGFSLGFNAMDLNITPNFDSYIVDSLYPEVSLISPGINIQIVIDFRPATHWDVRFLPGVSFGQRNVIYFKQQKVFEDGQKIESSFLEFPLLLKYKGDRLNNVRPYFIGGLNYRLDLASQKVPQPDEDIFISFERSDLYYEAGVGLDFYLPYFKLSVELKMSTGFSDILKRDFDPANAMYENAIERMNSRIWVLAFHFE